MHRREGHQPAAGPELSRVGGFHPGVETCMNIFLAILSVVFVALLASLITRINGIASAEETEANKARQRDALNPLWGTNGVILLTLLMMIIFRRRLTDRLATCMGAGGQCCERNQRQAPVYEAEGVQEDRLEVGARREAGGGGSLELQAGYTSLGDAPLTAEPAQRRRDGRHRGVSRALSRSLSEGGGGAGGGGGGGGSWDDFDETYPKERTVAEEDEMKRVSARSPASSVDSGFFAPPQRRQQGMGRGDMGRSSLHADNQPVVVPGLVEDADDAGSVKGVTHGAF